MKSLLLAAGFAFVLMTASASPILQAGAYEVAAGHLDRVASLEITITATNEFVATFVWWDDLPVQMVIRKRE